MRTSTIIETDSSQALQAKASLSQALDTQAFVRMIVERASTPFERLEEGFEQGQATDPLSMADHLDYWAKSLSSDGNRGKLQRFLSFSGLGKEDIEQMLAPAKLRSDISAPAWALTLEAILATDFEALEDNSPLDPQEVITFEEIVIPFVTVFRKHLMAATQEAYQLLTPAAHKAVERFLIRQISMTMGQVLFHEFRQHMTDHLGEKGLLNKAPDLPEGHYYRLFVSKLQRDNLQSFFQKYPVLARITSNLLHLHIEAFTRFLLRLEADRPAIKEYFELNSELGKVERLQLGISDPHKGGEGVMILHFAQNLKLVYKPRSMKMGVAYNDLCEWVNARLEPKLKVLKILPGDEYGWIEFASGDTCESEAAVKRYYERAGILLGITYLLDSTDFHAENIIASGEHPVLVDHETMLQPQLIVQKPTLTPEEQAKHKLMFKSVLRPALLPMNCKAANIQNDSMSGFGGIEDAENEVWAMECQYKNTDRMALGRKRHLHKVTSNLPKLGDKIERLPKYRKSLVKGFQKIYDLFIQERAVMLGAESPFNPLRDIQVRFLFRTTHVYTSILNNLLLPKYLKDGTHYGLRLELIARAFLTRENAPGYWAMLAAERGAMLNRDVPFFQVNSSENHLLVDNQHRVDSYFHSSCHSYLIEKLNSMGKDDYTYQLDIINKAIDGGFGDI